MSQNCMHKISLTLYQPLLNDAKAIWHARYSSRRSVLLDLHMLKHYSRYRLRHVTAKELQLIRRQMCALIVTASKLRRRRSNVGERCIYSWFI
jgi:hypothetical protein